MQDAASNLTIGVLALQGAFAKHQEMLSRLKVAHTTVRTQKELDQCDGLIIPGGESTTMLRLLDQIDLIGFNKPILGTCAGMIILANLGLLDVCIERNGYGRQIASTTATLSNGFEALFIRAPRITSIQSPDVEVLATYNDDPVWVKQGLHMACSFHPELTSDPQIHQAYLATFRQATSTQPIKLKVLYTKSKQSS